MPVDSKGCMVTSQNGIREPFGKTVCKEGRYKNRLIDLNILIAISKEQKGHFIGPVIW